eukprot:g41590.t1
MIQSLFLRTDGEFFLYQLGIPQGLKPPGPSDMALLCKILKLEDPTIEDLKHVDAAFLRANGISSAPVAARIAYGLNDFRELEQASRSATFKRKHSVGSSRDSSPKLAPTTLSARNNTSSVPAAALPHNSSGQKLVNSVHNGIYKGWLYQRSEGKAGSGILSKLRVASGESWNKLFAVLNWHQSKGPGGGGPLEMTFYPSDPRDSRSSVAAIQQVLFTGMQVVLLPPEKYGKPFCFHVVPTHGAGAADSSLSSDNLAFMFKSEYKLQGWVDKFRECGILVRSILKSGWLARRIETSSVASVDQGSMEVISVSWKRQWAILEMEMGEIGGRLLFHRQEDAVHFYEFDGLFRGCAVREDSYGKPNTFKVERASPSGAPEAIVLMAFSESERALWLKALQRLPDVSVSGRLSAQYVPQPEGSVSGRLSAEGSVSGRLSAQNVPQYIPSYGEDVSALPVQQQAKAKKSELEALRDHVRALEAKLAEAEGNAAQQTKIAQNAQAKLYDARTQLGQTRVLLQQASPSIRNSPMVTPLQTPTASDATELEALLRAAQLRCGVLQEQLDEAREGLARRQEGEEPSREMAMGGEKMPSVPNAPQQQHEFQPLFSLLLTQSRSGMLRLQHMPAVSGMFELPDMLVSFEPSTTDGCGRICNDVSKVMKAWASYAREVPQLSRQCKAALQLAAHHVSPADLEHLNFLANQNYFPLLQALQQTSSHGSKNDVDVEAEYEHIRHITAIARSWRKQYGLTALAEQLEGMATEGLFPGFLMDQVVVLLYLQHPLAAQLLEVHRSQAPEEAGAFLQLWETLWVLALEILRHATPKENLSLVLSDLYACSRISPAELVYLESLVQGNDPEPFMLYGQWLAQGDYATFAEGLIQVSSQWHNDLSTEEHQLLVFLLSFLADSAVTPDQFQQLEYALYLRDGSLLDAFSVLSAAAQRQTVVTQSSRPRVIRIRRRSAELAGFLSAISTVMTQIEPLIPPKMFRAEARTQKFGGERGRTTSVQSSHASESDADDTITDIVTSARQQQIPQLEPSTPDVP